MALIAYMAFSAASYAQGGCNDFRYYYADIANNGVTDIYQVTLTPAGDANLTFLVQSPEEVHIALNESSKTLYLIRKSDGAISTIDPLAPGPIAMSPFDAITPSIPGVVTATFDQSNNLIIGSETLDELYIVNPTPPTPPPYNATLYDSYSPIDGGDIAFDTNGDLYLASGMDLYMNVVALPPDIFIGALSATHLSTGLTRTQSGDFISSYHGSNQLLLHNSSAVPLPPTSYNLMLNGAAFTSNYGDMASGCVQAPPVVGQCQPFHTYYIQHGPGVAGSDLYEVTFSPGIANLNLVFNVPFEAHIGFDAAINTVYLVDKAGTSITHFPSGVTVPITPPLNGITAVVFDDLSQMLIVGDMYSDQLHSLSPAFGTHAPFGSANVSGGDLAIQGGTMYLASRSGKSFYEFTGSIPNFKGTMATPKVNGLAQANTGNTFITSNYGSNDFIEIDEFGASTGNLFAATLAGSPFTLLNGDMAAGCLGPGGGPGCGDFRYYYIADNTPGVPQGRVFTGQIAGNDFVLTPLFDSGISGHMAVSEISGNIYVVSSNGSSINTYDQNGVFQFSAPLAGLNSTTALVWHKANDTLYVGNASTDEVFAVDPTNGNLTLFANNLPVRGGDLISTENGKLILVKREPSPQPSKVYDITTGLPNYLFDVANSINGAALTDLGNYIMSEGDNSLNFHIYTTLGALGPVLNSVDNLGNPFPLFDGDMASACFDNVPPPPPGPKHPEVSESTKSQLSTYPNPSSGTNEVSFVAATSGKTILEVIDMSGRSLATLFSADANEGELYRIRFNGNQLPDGMYIYKLTTRKDVVITKFMIARQ